MSRIQVILQFQDHSPYATYNLFQRNDESISRERIDGLLSHHLDHVIAMMEQGETLTITMTTSSPPSDET